MKLGQRCPNMSLTSTNTKRVVIHVKLKKVAAHNKSVNRTLRHDVAPRRLLKR